MTRWRSAHNRARKAQRREIDRWWRRLPVKYIDLPYTLKDEDVGKILRPRPQLMRIDPGRWVHPEDRGDA